MGFDPLRLRDSIFVRAKQSQYFFPNSARPKVCLSKVLLILGCVFWLQNLPLSISQINILSALGQGGRGGGGPLLTKVIYLLS